MKQKARREERLFIYPHLTRRQGIYDCTNVYKLSFETQWFAKKRSAKISANPTN